MVDWQAFQLSAMWYRKFSYVNKRSSTDNKIRQRPDLQADIT